MKVALMQPYFFPYIGYWSLIKHTDKFILFDNVQYIRRGWIDRNRILKPNDGVQYVKVPLIKHSQSIKINEIKINYMEDWKVKILRQLEHYKKKAPYYKETMSVIESALSIDTESIVKLNENIIVQVCKYLNVNVNLSTFSQMSLEIDDVKSSDEWALNICKAMGNVDEYWNPEGGISFYEKSKYTKAGINIKFLKVNLDKYEQGRDSFEPGLSIIDVMMFNSVEDINIMLDNFQLL